MIEVGDLVRLREIVFGSNHRGVWLVVATRPHHGRRGSVCGDKLFTLQKGHKRVTCFKMHLFKV
jgi:hypothetical protein